MQELVTALQMCACVFENGVIMANYGLGGFFIAVYFILIVAVSTNEGYFGNMFHHLEQLVFGGSSSTTKLIVIGSGQFVGAALARPFIINLWHYTSSLSSTHEQLLTANLCAFQIQWDVTQTMMLEALFCFLLRFIFAFCTKTPFGRSYVAPAVLSGLLSASVYIIGLAGMNPMTSFSRLAFCPGLDDSLFYIIYWLCGSVGWLAGSQAQAYFTKSPKAAKAASKKKKN